MSTWQWSQVAGFQLVWFVAVLGGNTWTPVLALLIGLHFVFSLTPRADARVLALALIGLGVDAIFTGLGVFEFQQIPLWLVLLWLAFVLTLGHSLSWLRRLPLVWLAVIGAIGGTSSYLAGGSFDSVKLPLGSVISALLLIVVWAVMLPLLVCLDARLRVQI